MPHKPHLFIGSSTEGKEIAEFIESELSDTFECKIWYHQFELGNSAYEDLIRKLALYDYGLLVATCDDAGSSRGQNFKTIRDNVLFEFGLFTGRLGRHRSFLFAEKGVKIPSDLGGITLPFFESAETSGFARIFRKNHKDALLKKQKESIIAGCVKIRKHIENRKNIFDYGFLPSTSLAFGYFNNFVLKAMGNLLSAGTMKIHDTGEKIDFSTINLEILIPSDLNSDMFEKTRATRGNKEWEQIKIDTGGFRPFDFHIESSRKTGGDILLSDIPITLNALNDAIRSYVSKDYIGESNAERLLEDRELRVFKEVLDHLIEKNSITKKCVKTLLVDI